MAGSAGASGQVHISYTAERLLQKKQEKKYASVYVSVLHSSCVCVCALESMEMISKT